MLTAKDGTGATPATFGGPSDELVCGWKEPQTVFLLMS